MTEFSGATVDPDFKSITISVEVAEKEFYFYTGGIIYKFVTEDQIIDLISIVGKKCF